MPYRDPDVRKAYMRRKSREHYLEHRLRYIARSVARKRQIRQARRQQQQEWLMTKSRPCPKCGGAMTLDEVGGRRFWDCEKADCNGRILLDKQNREYTLSREILQVLEQPDIELSLPQATLDEPPPELREPTTKTYGSGKGPALSLEARRRIGEGVRRAAKERRRREAEPFSTTEPTQTPATVMTSGTAGLVGSPASPLVAIEAALGALEAGAQALQAKLTQNHEKQGALRKAADILREVWAA